MEPLSIAASLLAVLEATAVVSKATLALYRNARDAPKELADLLNRISRTRIRLDVQVQLCQSLTSGNLAKWIPDEALEAFQADLENARACLESVRDTIPATSNDSNSRHRFNWVVRDKRKVNKLLDNLRNIDSNLAAMLDTMSLALNLRSNELLNNLTANQLYLAAQLHCSPQTMGIASGHPPQITPSTTTAQLVAHGGGDIGKRARTPVQSTIAVGRQTDELRSASWVIAFFRLPSVLSSYAVCITIQIWLFRLSWPSLKHSWALKEILPQDSLFVQACAAGDVEPVKQLALNGKGMPSSIDETGRPMLHYAIRSGSFELVKFLLYNGATPDDVATRCQVSPLQEACQYGHSDIARLLLAKGAFLEHTDLGGHTAFTMLWVQSSLRFCRVELLRILLAYSPLASVLDASEPGGPFACAAMKGDARDLELLTLSGVRMGHCADTSAMVASKVIKYSIFGTNIATFDYLVSSLPREWIDEVDPMGRGPLHLALEFSGHHVKEMVKRLLDAGADVHLRDLNGYDAGEVARACDARAEHGGKRLSASPGNVRAYYEALISNGFEVELDRENRLWWPSRDGMGI